jgi:hypothetical protein
MTTSQGPLTHLQGFKKVLHEWLHIEDDSYIDVIFGAICANKLDAKPVWAYIVGPPGGGKTEVLQACDGHPLVYSLTTLTSHTLVSGKVLDPGEPDPSLLPKLNGKTLLIRDFSALLTGRREDLSQVLGQLRDAYDGTVRAVFGTGKDTEYKTKFGILAATTPEIDRHVGLLSPLGERFLMIRQPPLTEAETKARTLLAAEGRSTKDQEEALRRAAHQVLDLAIVPVVPETGKAERQELADVAEFVAVARTAVIRNGYDKEIEALPEPEVPTRIAKQLVSLTQGIAIARQSGAVTKEEVNLAKIAAFSCIHPIRWKLLRCLAVVSRGTISTPALQGQLNLKSGSLVRHALEDLEALGVVQRQRGSGSPLAPDEWSLRGKYVGLLSAWKGGCP